MLICSFSFSLKHAPRYCIRIGQYWLKLPHEEVWNVPCMQQPRAQVHLYARIVTLGC